MAEQSGESETDWLGARAVRAIHGRAIFSRRVRVLASELAKLIPPNCKVLDVGSGSGDIAAAILAERPDIQIQGVDVFVREKTLIPVRPYDGRTLPFADGSFDCAMLVDVLHHTDDPSLVIREVSRVAPTIIIKDHYRNGFLGGARLRLMDWVGNAAHGVRLPYNYLARTEWNALWRQNGLVPQRIVESVPLYPPPLSWFFGRGLHFIGLIQLEASASN